MSNYIYTRGYTVAELEALLVRVKTEREKYLQSASDSGSSYSRIVLSEIEKKFNCIMDALEQQNRANVEMGLKTLEESFAECGQDFEDEMRTRADNARFIMRLAGIPDSEPIPLYMLYKVNGTQVIENRKIGEKENNDE